MKRTKFEIGTVRTLKALSVVPAILIAVPSASGVVQAAGGAVPASGDGVAFYAAAATLVAIFVLLNAALRNRIGLYYAVLFAFMLAVVWVLDQGAGTVPLGLADGVERVAALSLAFVACTLGFFTAERAIAPDRGMIRVRRCFTALAGVSLLLAIAAWFLPMAVAVPVVNALLAAMLVGHIVPTVTWRTLAGKPFRLPALTAGLLFVAVAVLYSVYGLSPAGGLVGGEAFDAAWLRWLFALVALPAMAAIALSIIDLARAREAALEAAVTSARKQADTAESLLEMEKNYAQARNVAARQTRLVSTVAHDIRQPISALRAELDALRTDLDDVHADRFARILDHFDALTGELAAESVTGAAEPQASAAEDVPAALLFSMLERLFAVDAAAQGIRLRFVPGTAVFHAPAVALMRIASNLISNAIAHSGATRILVGVRPGGEGLRLVVLDNGNGFADVGLDAARASGIKGPASGGSGLGLSIVDEIAAENGFDVNAGTAPGQGTWFSISVPRGGKG